MTARQLSQPSAHMIADRNVHIYNGDGQIIGGVFQNGSITQKNLFEMCEVFLDIQGYWTIFTVNSNGETGTPVGRNRDRLGRGIYIVLSPGRNPVNVTLSLECAPRRVLSKRESTERQTPRKKHFHEQVRARDHYCMISGRPNPRAESGRFLGFEAVHIFPVAREATWIRNGYSNWIADNTTEKYIGHSKLHSPQNGLLLSSTVHHSFDAYAVSVNPDDGYKVVSFIEDVDGLDGRTLEPRCRVPGHSRVSDDCLRWHFHQAILANMKGAGEKPWDTMLHDEGTIEHILQLPDGPARIEAELFNRLGAGELSSPSTPESGSS